LQKLGKYEVLAELGHGAMGVVYKARDPFIGRLVALKTINSNLVDRPDLLERFYQEAQSAGKLQHPNIVTVFELGQEKDTPFIAMEYLDGDSLEKTIVRQTELPLAMKVGYIVRICQALEYAHKNRVVHRDIKPGNIMVNSEGVVKVVDFGIARLVDFSRTHTNMMIGTPAYMAPELFRKKKADERTDIWAVGVTFYELICYQRPFTGDGYDIIRAIMEDEFPPISSVVPDCTFEVESIIQRMLRKQSAERYQSMEDVLLDLEPVWNRLRASAAASLAERARELYDLGDLPKAQDTLRRARQIDNSNAQAKSLLEKISAELRRTEIQPRVQEHLSRGRSFLQSGQFREAQAEAEAALGLDSRHESAQKLIAEVEVAAARAQQLEQKLRLAKQRLAEGAIAEAESALRQAVDLDASHPQVLELKRQIGEEQTRRERRKQLGELLHQARALWTELKYDECLALLAEGLRAFPNEPELRNLQETARADQAEQKKQGNISEVRKLLGQRKLAEARTALEALSRGQPLDTTVRNLQALLAQEEQEQKRKKRLEEELANLRSLVSTGKLREAVARGEALLREFPQEYEVNDLVIYARGEVAQQEQKKNELDREKQIRGLLEAHRYREAADVARRALQEFPKQEIFRKFAAEAEEKSTEQQEKEKIQREVQQRIQEIRGKIKRQELTDAIDMARQTLATFGPDTDVTQLLQAAEVEADERNKKQRERKQQFDSAQALVDKGDFDGARQLLDRAIANRIIQSSDMQARMMLSQIAEKEEILRRQEQKRGKEEERKREEKNKEEEKKRREAQKKSKLETKTPEGPASEEKTFPGSGAGGGMQGPLPPPNAPTLATPTLAESATSIAGSVPRQKPSVPVLTPLPAAQPVPVIQTQIRIEEQVEETRPAPAPSGFLRKPAVLAVLTLVLAGGIYAVIHLIPKTPGSPSKEDTALAAEAKQLWDDRKMDDSLADWKRLASHPGLLHDDAAKQVKDIEQKRAYVEQLYAEGMKFLYEDKKSPEAAQKFNEVLQMNLWKMDEARREYAIASKGPGTTPAKPLWQALFEEGKQAFDKKDYAAALQYMQQASQTNGISKDVDAQAQRLIPVIRDRGEQLKTLQQAMKLEQSGEKQQAKELFARAAKSPNGDPEVTATANSHIYQIGTIAPQPNPNSGSSANTNSNPGKNPPDYAPVLGEVRGLISQARWEDADTKLKGVPPAQPEYSDLKREIDTGRREDQDFTQKKADYELAHSSKNKEGLRGLRPFFMGEANKQPGRHNGEARTIVTQIDSDLAEPKQPSEAIPSGTNGGVKPAVNDAAAIKSVLEAYAHAFDNGDMPGLKVVRQLNPSEEKRLSDAFKNEKGKGYSMQNCSEVKINGDTASVSCDVVLTKLKDLRPARTNLTLNRINGKWIIVSTN
jgi:serine/threonine protein kinase